MNRILDLVREAGRDHRLQSHGEKLPDELRTLIFHETTAATIESYEQVFVPGLLQTADYALALFHDIDRFSGDSVGFRVDARLGRQSLLRRPQAPGCVFYVHENVLRTRVGSARTMHEQLLQLVFVSSNRCAIRVVPTRSGGRGLAQTSFRLMRYAEHDPVVYVEQEAASLFLDRKEQTNHYAKVLRRLDSVALDGGESRRMLADLASEYERAQEGHDA